MHSKRPDLPLFKSEIPKGNHVILAQAITLVESVSPGDIILANQLIETLLPLTGRSVRIGITGVPGVGKSTFIEAFGKHLTSLSKKIAVLAIDPSSTKTKGSILGDKTRMEELSKDAFAFIRPTATRTALGGVADRTRETILLCEAAGFEIIIVETVGVGQSETSVRNLVDFFLLLMLSGAGDELQGIKKGIMEMADAILITKADGDNTKKASQAKADFEYALHLFSESDSGWKPKVITASALEKKGITETWSLIEQYVTFTKANGYFEKHRTQQNLVWFHEHMQQLLQQKLNQDTEINSKINAFEKEITRKKILPSRAAKQIIQDFLKKESSR
ncbi:MAG: methylmalonyl Co-A mutase-associated GTPase MeaB [Cyclobacteriaceae bacterium]|nr:methylmalonyl Co-A mutase-associated GTPase MeaB [Cyclobacteriaceae bacterium]